MRTPLIPLALALVLGSALPARSAGAPRAKARTVAMKPLHDVAAEAYKQEQQARLVYWVYTYEQTLRALEHGSVDPVRPYPREPVIEALFERMSPGAQAYARKLQTLEKQTMAKRPSSAVGRTAVTQGIHAILAALHQEQKLLDAMPVRYRAQ